MSAEEQLRTLLSIMEQLRAPGGCAWDRKQTFASIAPHTIEEAYEVVDAIERNDMPQLKDELGDLLFQVVFHAQLAHEAGRFDFADVAASISEKLIRRHPHVFEPDVGRNTDWEDIKAHERQAAASTQGLISALQDVPLTLPALLRASKLSKRAARVGFDFEETEHTADKVAEELAEVRQAAAASTDSAPSAHLIEEVGDLLFAAANLARKLNVDAETALRAANIKFERRFRAMENLAAERGQRFDALGLDAQEALWQEVKRGE